MAEPGWRDLCLCYFKTHSAGPGGGGEPEYDTVIPSNTKVWTVSLLTAGQGSQVTPRTSQPRKYRIIKVKFKYELVVVLLTALGCM